MIYGEACSTKKKYSKHSEYSIYSKQTERPTATCCNKTSQALDTKPQGQSKNAQIWIVVCLSPISAPSTGKTFVAKISDPTC